MNSAAEVGTDTSVLSAGLSAADHPDASPEEQARYRAEAEQVTHWFREYDAAREFDKVMRMGYARDRRYARGDSGAEVSVPLIGTAIDTMRSFLYARDPKVDCVPAQQVEAPPEPMPQPPQQPMGLAGLAQDPTAALASPMVTQGLAQGGIEGAAMAAGQEIAQQQADYQIALAKYQTDLAMWQAKQQARRVDKRNRQLFAQSMEIVVQKSWKRACLKARARKAVVSTLTVGIGWAKVSWQENSRRDPVVDQQLQDLQKLLIRIDREEQTLAEGEMSAEQQQVARLQIEQQIAAAQENVFQIVSRGLCVEFVPAQNIQIPAGIEVMDYLDGPWMGHTVYMTIGDAAVKFPGLKLEKLRKATRYHMAQKNVAEGQADVTQPPESPVDVKEAERFVPAGGEGSPVVSARQSDDDYIQVIELWSIDDGTIYTVIRGLDCYACPPAPPNVKSERFYGFFALAFIDEDGERAPKSMTNRSWKLQNEYNGRRSALKVARQRMKPGIMVDGTEVDDDNLGKIVKGVAEEYIVVKTTSGKALADCFAPKPVSNLNPELYDTGPILRDFERVWGTQEALSGSVEVDKTATEADIQQTGFRSRTGDMRDQLEEWLSDIANYSAVTLYQKLDKADVLALAGPDAVWPDLEPGESIESLLQLDIRAGSTGKPDSAKEREAWAAVAPLLQSAAVQVGQLRQASPAEIADKVEALAQETANRAGDVNLDVSKFIPQNEGMMLAPNGQPTAPVAPVGGAPGPMPPAEQPAVPSAPPSPVENVPA